MPPFPIIAVDNAPGMLEQSGTKEKFWYKDQSGKDVLCKLSRPGTGEHWSEKIASELCVLLGIPHAQYDLATWRGRKAVVSPKFISDTDRLVLGNVIFSREIRGYDAAQRYKQRYHTAKLV